MQSAWNYEINNIVTAQPIPAASDEVSMAAMALFMNIFLDQATKDIIKEEYLEMLTMSLSLDGGTWETGEYIGVYFAIPHPTLTGYYSTVTINVEYSREHSQARKVNLRNYFGTSLFDMQSMESGNFNSIYQREIDPQNTWAADTSEAAAAYPSSYSLGNASQGFTAFRVLNNPDRWAHIEIKSG